MNKFRFKVTNYLLYYKFSRTYKKNKIDYPAILSHLDKTYGKPQMVEDFMNLESWKVMDKDEWGSARPETLCTYVKENVLIKSGNGKNSLVISTTPDPATGKGWSGEEISRSLSSGQVSSKFLVSPGRVISATVNTSDSYPGSWFSFWMYKKDVPGDERYREVDIFEKFMERKNQKQYSMSVHGGTKNSRELLAFSFPLFFVDEDKITFTCELSDHKVRIFVNGVQLFLAEEPDFNGEYFVIFGDGPTTHEGKVTLEEIMKVLPRSIEVLDFRVHSL